MADNFEDDDDLECKVDVAKPSVDRSKSALQANSTESMALGFEEIILNFVFLIFFSVEEKGKNAYYYAWKKDSLNSSVLPLRFVSLFHFPFQMIRMRFL